ncbi:hypothetical protein ASPACDRAFT_1857673 [Aspergillus aculeatus ATCC 16872]|uniref:Major facilitator superfamily (MFS) profile domain-containing protein n=1 Tax=Aspergillus aculeatus (strain ATCC 16872 / CBS 172.66 / WB 5094) TaxID=690307 RepID=A0A1L9WQC5_ASPA1|nr:uncharacterized protein ASPACDRAFT_1857673 [Aspergillus aculeatus ATCC 16872]OJJ98383.1 hypothetical protein ASPACDRAFT_1857673 [Aspergillus aculeatus ATCC 16872]
MSTSRMVAIITCITCITGLGNLLAGLLTVCIPTISTELQIPAALQLWPTSAFALAYGCTLLPFGAATDILGCRRACLLGGLIQTASAVGAGLARISTQLIALRVVAGIAVSFCLPGAVGVTANVFPANQNPRRRTTSGTDESTTFASPLNILLLCIATLLIPAFIYWMHRQTRRNRPALIHNTLWTNLPFTSICITVFLLWGTLNAGEQLTALYLQDVRDVSALTFSLYFLPAPICGLLMNVAIGALLPYLRPSVTVPAGCLAERRPELRRFLS